MHHKFYFILFGSSDSVANLPPILMLMIRVLLVHRAIQSHRPTYYGAYTCNSYSHTYYGAYTCNSYSHTYYGAYTCNSYSHTYYGAYTCNSYSHTYYGAYTCNSYILEIGSHCNTDLKLSLCAMNQAHMHILRVFFHFQYYDLTLDKNYWKKMLFWKLANSYSRALKKLNSFIFYQ